ncbi:MAG: TolC family outer membrane protein [Chromatiaceae bacterium]|nr:TolC family outer membrane protein [Chromatiaceae bacterium]
MRTVLIAISVAIGLGFAAWAPAEDLIQIYDLAVQSDPVIKEAQQSLYATREIKPQARALLLPNFSVNADAQYQNDKTTSRSFFNGTSVPIARNDTYDSQGLTASITQSVYNRADWIRLDQSNDTIAQAEAQYRDAQIELMVRTTLAYFDVLRAADAVGVQEALQRANERQLEQSKQRFDVGLVAITDVNESQAAYDRSRANVITAQNDLNNKWEALRRIIGPVSVPLARLGERLPLTPPQPNDIDVWADTALKNNYGIIAALEASQSAKKQIDIARSGHFPTLNLQAGYDLARTGAEFGTDRDTGFVALNMSLPLYQGGAVTSRTRQAGYDFRASQDRLDQERRRVLNSVKDSFRGIISSISDVQARQAAVVSARSALESTQAGLEVGTRTQVDVLNAQQRLFQAEFDYLDSRYNYIINGVLLHQATSTLSRDVLLKGNAWLNPKDTVQPPTL